MCSLHKFQSVRKILKWLSTNIYHESRCGSIGSILLFRSAHSFFTKNRLSYFLLTYLVCLPFIIDKKLFAAISKTKVLKVSLNNLDWSGCYSYGQRFSITILLMTVLTFFLFSSELVSGPWHNELQEIRDVYFHGKTPVYTNCGISEWQPSRYEF